MGSQEGCFQGISRLIITNYDFGRAIAWRMAWQIYNDGAPAPPGPHLVAAFQAHKVSGIPEGTPRVPKDEEKAIGALAGPVQDRLAFQPSRPRTV